MAPDDSNGFAQQDATGQEDDFSIEAVLEFQRRLQAEPDSVTDEEIRDHFGDDLDAPGIREAFRRNTFGRPPKNPRTSARGKLRRRLTWLSEALEQVEDAVDVVLEAPGRTNRRDELDALKKAISEFRSTTKLRPPPEPGPIDPDMFERMFGDANPPLTEADLRPPITLGPLGEDEEG